MPWLTLDLAHRSAAIAVSVIVVPVVVLLFYVLGRITHLLRSSRFVGHARAETSSSSAYDV